MLPSLLSQGLLKTRNVYSIPDTHYYGLESVVLTLAFMALARIKNPEQLKQCKPGEIGKIIGLDRIPEVRCLRGKIKLLSNQNKAQELNNILINDWYSEERKKDAAFLYIDGHVRIYYGEEANLPSKFISRQKLCLSATSEFWVNDVLGQPVMMVIGELTEKLQHVIEQQIVPQLKQTNILQGKEKQNTPVCTLIFDREAYDIPFFARLWEQHKIAVITYRKNVKDEWSQSLFTPSSVRVLNNEITMHLCESIVMLGGHEFREVRRLTTTGHQTSIITNNANIDTQEIAGKMFARWSQENFFRYMIIDYDFDKMIEFGTEAIDEEKEVVNPSYRRMNHKIKKEKEKVQRLKAKLYDLTEKSMEDDIEVTAKNATRFNDLTESINNHEKSIQELLDERDKIKPKIKIREMGGNIRYNKLKTEGKILMNIIKMICYRAETAMANIIDKEYYNEKRMIIKQIIETNADIIPNEADNTLTVTLHSLSTPRFNVVAEKVAHFLNETETTFPGTNLKIIYKTSASSICER